MKQKVDIVIRYEHKVRELESVMLLKLEMERRGYSVVLTANYDYKDNRRLDPTLIVSPAIYNDSRSLVTDFSRYGLKTKVANLLWEQLMGIEEEESPTGPHNIYGTGQKIPAFCWGNNTKRRLNAVGMPEKNTIVVGQINTDLLRGEFVNNLMTKAELSKRYGIDKRVRWNLFVSSFAYCEMDDIQQTLAKQVYGDKYYREFTEMSIKSRHSILEWFETILKVYTDDILIYRPHPDEIGKSTELTDLEKKYSNFRIISDFSLKHWINASDKIYNWYSTGIIDAFFLDKPSRTLRPCVIPKDYDYRLFYNSNQIRTLQDLLDDYSTMDNRGIDYNLIEDYYYLPKRYVYMEICDVLEKMLKTNDFDIHFSLKEKLHYGIPYIKLSVIKQLLFLKPLFRKFHLFEKTFSRSDNIKKLLDDGYKKNVATEEELGLLEIKYKPIIYGRQV